jgi:hypothetical protein
MGSPEFLFLCASVAAAAAAAAGSSPPPAPSTSFARTHTREKFNVRF